VSIPAVIFLPADSAAPKVASLTTLDRLLVAAHRAGCAPLYVVGQGPTPALRRSDALGIRHEVVAVPPALDGPAFVATSQLLLTVQDVRALVEQRARLVQDGRELPAGVVESFSGRLDEDLASAHALAPCGIVALVTDKASAKGATRALWASLTSSSDGLVDRHFNRPVGRLLSKLLIHTPISPNQISVFATLLGILSACFFAVGTHTAALAGAVLLQLSAIVDCVDGDVARAVFKESTLGRWLDIVGDQVVHIGVFVALGVGLWRAGTEAPVLALAASAGVGVVISFAVVLRGLLNPELQKNTALQKLIDATTNRDFSVLLLALACVDRLAWFLWLAAFGVHAFWMIALSLQIKGRAPASA
jgi:phosphatidylglycerophosphate synthase